MIPDLTQVELELIAEDITSSCRDIAGKIETGKEDGEDRLTLREHDLCDQISYKLIAIFFDELEDMEETMN